MSSWSENIIYSAVELAIPMFLALPGVPVFLPDSKVFIFSYFSQ